MDDPMSELFNASFAAVLASAVSVEGVVVEVSAVRSVGGAAGRGTR
jgi:hypothetical protein